MRRNAHVRFGGRPAETHPRKRGQGAAGRPYTYVPTWSGFCCTAFVTGPVLPPDRRLGHQQPHGAPHVGALGRRGVDGPPAAARGTDFVLGALEQAIQS